MKYIGIVGSRNRSEIKHITYVLNYFKEKMDITLVSGGAKGIDTEAEKIAKSLYIPTFILKPNMSEYKIKGNSIYFERNKLIAEKSDWLFAYPLNMKGGTMNTVKHFRELGKSDNLYISE